jgi:hypothetical protein
MTVNGAKKGDIIFNQGSYGTKMYLCTKGKLAVLVDKTLSSHSIDPEELDETVVSITPIPSAIREKDLVMLRKKVAEITPGEYRV